MHDQGLCVYAVSGCTVEQSINHDPAATIDDGSCVHKFSGCTDANASNFDAAANWEDGSCRPVVEGCVMLEALNYNPNATYMASEASCVFPVYGCTDSFTRRAQGRAQGATTDENRETTPRANECAVAAADTL